ncbi:MAG TPA: homoserine kinase, partial [Thermoanaerobaculia bacterium]
SATAFAPGSIGNVGPGFDVLAIAVDGIGDRVTVELTRGRSKVLGVSGRDVALVPVDADKNSAAIAANAYLRPFGYRALITLEKGLALAAGMGGSAASSVAGAYAAALALGQAPVIDDVIAAALEGEVAVAGWHLDNIAASAVGGLALSRSSRPIDVVRLPVAAPWWLTLVTPHVRIETRHARSILPETADRGVWIQQMANSLGVAHAFAVGDGALLARSLDDLYAEPLRSPLIPYFSEVKLAALATGAFGCSISGSGPTVFVVSPDEGTARACAESMQQAFRDVASDAYAGRIAEQGVRRS